MNGRVTGELALQVDALRKEFRFYPHPWDRLVEWASGGRLQRGQVFVALDHVSFAVRRGGALGIIGANGAGKSTLLKIICGTLYPTGGRVAVHGRIASLLELGTGFHPDFTGRQNIIFNARFLGLSDEEIHGRMGDIIAFSELGDFIDRPLRTYSSGMYVRLAFAVLANVDPQILVIDEALAVGDVYFQQKCTQRVRRFREDGVTLLFVSHDPAAVKTLCDDALLLHHGRVVGAGRPDDVLAHYNTLIARETGSREILQVEAQRTPTNGTAASRRSGNFAAIIEEVSLRDAPGRECRSFIAGEEAEITVRGVCLEAIEDPTVGMLIRDRLGNDTYGTNTYHQEVTTGRYDIGERLEVTFRVALNIGPGEYSLTVAMHTLDVHVHDSFDWIDRMLVFRVLPPPTHGFIGAAFLRPQVIHRRLAERYQEQGQWERTLTQVFGQDFPRTLTMGEQGKPWCFSGWHTPESGDGRVFCWTTDHFSCLLDLRGEAVGLEVGANHPGDVTVPVELTAWVFDQCIGTVPLNRSVPWAVVSFPLPPRCRVAHGFVRWAVAGWRPADVGVSEDRRVLGVQVRRVWVAEAQPDG